MLEQFRSSKVDLEYKTYIIINNLIKSQQFPFFDVVLSELLRQLNIPSLSVINTPSLTTLDLLFEFQTKVINLITHYLLSITIMISLMYIFLIYAFRSMHIFKVISPIQPS